MDAVIPTHEFWGNTHEVYGTCSPASNGFPWEDMKGVGAEIMREEEHGERGRCCRLPWVCASLPVSSRPEICLTWRRAEISDNGQLEQRTLELRRWLKNRMMGGLEFLPATLVKQSLTRSHGDFLSRLALPIHHLQLDRQVATCVWLLSDCIFYMNRNPSC